MYIRQKPISDTNKKVFLGIPITFELVSFGKEEGVVLPTGGRYCGNSGEAFQNSYTMEKMRQKGKINKQCMRTKNMSDKRKRKNVLLWVLSRTRQMTRHNTLFVEV